MFLTIKARAIAKSKRFLCFLFLKNLENHQKKPRKCNSERFFYPKLFPFPNNAKARTPNHFPPVAWQCQLYLRNGRLFQK